MVTTWRAKRPRGRHWQIQEAQAKFGVEQLTLLLFLKMADQRTEPPYLQEPLVPSDASGGRRELV